MAGWVAANDQNSKNQREMQIKYSLNGRRVVLVPGNT